jgi:membrane protease YdiL (CAAX protease family)
MSTATASAERPAVATTSRPAGLGHVLVFSLLSVSLAAAATLTRNIVQPAMVPFLLAFGPTVIALAFAWREGAVRRLLRTAITRPNGRVMYLAIALPLVWAFAVIGVAVALGEPTTGLFNDVFPRIVFIVLLVLLPAFGEEIAWRGWAVTRLLPTMSPLSAALLIGIPWGAIHLFLQLPDQMNAGLEAWPTMVSLVSYSVILTWAYVASGGSVLLSALVHAGLNGVAPLLANMDVDRTWIIRAVVSAGFALAIVALGGFRRTPQVAR